MGKNTSAPRTADYTRGYQSGRNARDRDRVAWEMRHQADVLAVAQRAERAESAKGIGHCEECLHWERHQNCAWGWCNASRTPGSPWGCWAQGPIINEKYDKGRISTTPLFGCVLFVARNDAAKGLG